MTPAAVTARGIRVWTDAIGTWTRCWVDAETAEAATIAASRAIAKAGWRPAELVQATLNPASGEWLVEVRVTEKRKGAPL
ncbi:MAG: hypothetical protein H0V07_00610 [Propionibacteriales bacterium]|nr:hypothetical protein [Propionibacteriales bacterium]